MSPQIKIRHEDKASGSGKGGRCLLCGAPLPGKALLEFHNMPASAQDIPAEDELPFDRGMDLSLFVCESCGLCQFDCEPVSYYRDVIRAVGLSETMRGLRREDYRHMIEHYGLSGGSFIECGCGNGDFLYVLSEFPVKIYGTEANRENARLAADRLGSGISCMFPDSPDADIPGAPFDCFLSFNFLEHQPDPVSMLKAMRKNLREGGYGLLTVPSLEYILEEGNYYEFIRDHIANYDLDSLGYLCRLCGFEILEEGRIGIGDTLRMVLRKLPEEGLFKEENAESPGINLENIYSRFEKVRDNQKNIADKLKKHVEMLESNGRRLALWGAGHQGFTIASTTVLAEAAEYMIDSAGFKQGRYAPASHIPIVSPEYFLTHPVDEVMITAPGYVKEIKGTIEDLCKKEGVRIPDITDIRSMAG